jgi:hypothetical protein
MKCACGREITLAMAAAVMGHWGGKKKGPSKKRAVLSTEEAREMVRKKYEKRHRYDLASTMEEGK